MYISGAEGSPWRYVAENHRKQLAYELLTKLGNPLPDAHSDDALATDNLDATNPKNANEGYMNHMR